MNEGWVTWDEAWEMSSTWTMPERIDFQKQLLKLRLIAGARAASDGPRRGNTQHEPVKPPQECRCRRRNNHWDTCARRMTAEDMVCDNCRAHHRDEEYEVAL